MSTNPKALITGITGQDGSLPRRAPAREGLRGRRHGPPVQHGHLRAHRPPPGPTSRSPSATCSTRCSMIELLEDHQPDEVYNLAAQSFVPTSFDQPVLTGEITGLGVTRLLDAIRIVDPSIRFYQASSSEMFGKVLEVPQTEATPFYPRSPYGVAKVYGHWITVNYRESYGLHASSRHPVQPREPPPRPRVRAPARSPTASPRSSSACRTSCASATSTPSATGASPATTSRRCGSCSSRTSPTTTSSPPARPTRSASSCELAFDHVGLDWENHVVIDERFFRPAEVDLLVGDSQQGPREARLEAQDVVRRAGADDGRRRPRPPQGRPQATSALSGTGSTAVLGGGVGAARFLRGLVQVVAPADGHRHRQRRRRHRAARPAHQPRPRHGHLHARRRDRPRAGLGPARRDVAGHGDARALRRPVAGSTSATGPRHPPRTAPSGCRGATLRGHRRDRPRPGTSSCTLLPVTDDRLRTLVVAAPTRGEIGFQEYFVGRQHDVPVTGVRFDGADVARPAPGVLEAIADADAVVIAPSNPIVSIGPLLAVPGVRDAVVAARRAHRRPSPRSSPAPRSRAPPTGCSPSSATRRRVVGVARLYRDVAATLVIDEADADLRRRRSRPRGSAAW